MSFVHDDNTLDLSRESGYVLHLKAKLQAQTAHMDWLQDNLNAAKLQRKISLIITGLAVSACLIMFANWG
jgi:hypothetical protein